MSEGRETKIRDAEIVDDLSTLDMIDLPRLKMRLRPRLDEATGEVRLHLLSLLPLLL